MLSRRAQRVKGFDFLMSQFFKILGDEYNPDSNPKGIVNLGIAENKLCEDIMLQKIKELTLLEDVVDRSVLYYYDARGISQFRNTISELIEDRFSPREKLTVLSGVGACLNCLAITFANEGDVFLCPTPCYSRIQTDMSEIAGANIYKVPMFDETCEDPFQLRIEVLETYLTKAKQEGLTVKGVILISPHNPTGKVYSKEELDQLLAFCCRENLHVIVDEIFALSTQGENTFTSLLSLNIPDPEKTHWMWGLSKDFGLSGYRCGVIYTKNPEVNTYLANIAYYSSIPAQTQTILNGILSDKELDLLHFQEINAQLNAQMKVHKIRHTDWMSNTYFPLCYCRSKEAWNMAMAVLNELEIPTAYSGRNVLFLWVDLSKFLKERTREAELELFNKFMDAGVYICPGTEMFCTVPGWFRISYTTYKDSVKEGLERFKAVLQDAADNLSR